MTIECIIPSGNGGINGEGRTLREICEKPVPEHLIKNGHVDFSAIAWPGVTARLPEKDALVAAIRQNYPGISLDDITPRSIRDITYYIGRKALADRYGITISKAAHIIGLLDLVIHETDDGRIEIVPNNVHRFKQLYAHKGYVSKMLKLINGKEVADEDE